MAKQAFNFIQEGFDAIDQSLASGDPGVGALIDEFIDKLSPAVARNQNVPEASVKSAARFAINGRVEQTFNQQQKSSKTKTGALQLIGSAERKKQVQLRGLKMDEAAFKKKIAMLYTKAAVSAAGQFIAEGFRSGAFTKETPDVDLKQLSAQTAEQIDVMPDRVGRAQLKHATTLQSGSDPNVEPSYYSLMNTPDLPMSDQLTPAMEKLRPPDFSPAPLGARGTSGRGPTTQKSLGIGSFGKSRDEISDRYIDPVSVRTGRHQRFNPQDDRDEVESVLRALTDFDRVGEF